MIAARQQAQVLLAGWMRLLPVCNSMINMNNWMPALRTSTAICILCSLLSILTDSQASHSVFCICQWHMCAMLLACSRCVACSGQPAGSLPMSAEPWACNTATHGAICSTPCKSGGYFGPGFTSTCLQGGWSTSTGLCTKAGKCPATCTSCAASVGAGINVKCRGCVNNLIIMKVADPSINGDCGKH